MKKSVTKLAALCLLVLPFINPLYAQEQFAILEGIVADANTGETMPFANVAIYKNNELFDGGATDLDGNVKIEPLPPGKFEIKVSFIGYETMVFSDHELKAGVNGLVALLEPDTTYDIIEEVVIYGCCCCCRICYPEEEAEEIIEEVEQAKLSIDNLELVEAGFRIFPNPASDFITLEFAQDVPSIQLVDFNGRILTDIAASAFQRDLLPVSTYPAGFYTLRFFLDGKWESEKIVITH